MSSHIMYGKKKTKENTRHSKRFHTHDINEWHFLSLLISSEICFFFKKEQVSYKSTITEVRSEIYFVKELL